MEHNLSGDGWRKPKRAVLKGTKPTFYGQAREIKAALIVGMNLVDQVHDGPAHEIEAVYGAGESANPLRAGPAPFPLPLAYQRRHSHIARNTCS
ncbi:hypothetical protein [Stutzerimonas stutzeri]|uniref:hypothetical protein n=1 Tax=Stutzerimonas stutzeri TaxID=316 RepID=UPI0023510F5A|nr:hypothetical protein [Stutzerimonas stutzeri]